MKIKSRSFSLIIFIILICAAPFTTKTIGSGSTNGLYLKKSFASAYIEHDPIVITSDADFQIQGWSGNGTVENPFIIEGLNITDSSTCIAISNVRVVFRIQHCVLTGSTNGYGISLYNTSFGTISNCTVNNARYGFWLSTCFNCTLMGNSAIGQSYSGFHLYKSTNCTFIHDIALSSGQNNFDISDSINISLLYNYANYSDEYGYSFDNASYTHLGSNVAWENNYGGFTFTSSENCFLFNNSIAGHSSGKGIHMDYCYESVLVNNSVIDHSSGIDLFRSNYSTVDNSTIQLATDGLVISESGNCDISNNIIEASFESLLIYKSRYCTIQKNRLIDSGFKIQSDTFSEWIHDMFGNTINGQSLGYFKNQKDVIIDASQFGQLVIVNSTNIDIYNGTFDNVNSAIILAFCMDCIIQNSTASQVRDKAFMIFQSINCSIKHNNITNVGNAIHVSSSSFCNISNNRIYNSWGLAIYIELSPECLVSENFVFNITFKGIAIDHSQGCVLLKNIVRYMIDLAAGTGIDLYYSESCTLINNTSSDNYGTGFEIEYSGGSKITNNVAENNRDDMTTNYDNGFDLSYSPNCILQDNLATNNSKDGFGLVHSDGCTISGNVAVNNSGYGFYVFHSGTYSSHVNISNNIALENGFTGICVSDCIHTEVRNNVAKGNLNDGFDLYYSDYFVVSENIACNNSYSGFEITRGIDFVIDENRVFGNLRGIYLCDESYDGTITRNAVYENFDVGLLITSSSYNLQLYDNIIGFNANSNAEDDGGINIWDNGIDFGNYWDDYLGTGEYIIAGSASATDRYPQTLAPIIDSPGNVTYVIGSEGNEIIWHALALYPGFYEIFRNGTQMASSSWNGSDVFINVDGLEIGTYNYTLIISDTKALNATDTIFVTVINDIFPPIINHPDDLILEYGTSTMSIEWQISDDNPESYSIIRNGNVISSASINTSTISVTVNTFTLGIQNYTILVSDSYGNVAYDTVLVDISDTTAPVITGPEDMNLAEGYVDTELIWHPFDLLPFSYLLYINGIPGTTQDWNGSEITHPIANLVMGVYNFTIIVYDSSRNHAKHSVLVTITDVTNPIIEGPEDLSYTEGDTDNIITWTIYDTHPGEYLIYLNGELNLQGAWNITGESLTISVDGLIVGSYNYTLVAIDTSGNVAIDSVFVIVTQSVTTSTTTITTTSSTTTTESSTGTSSSNNNGMGIILIGFSLGGAITIISIAVFIFSRRKRV